MGVVGGHQRLEDHVVAEDLLDVAVDTGAVLQAGAGEGPVDGAMGGLGLVAAQVQGLAGAQHQAGVELVHRPGAVHVLGVVVVVVVAQAGPGPFGQCSVAVDPVVGQPAQQGGPAGDALGAALLDAEGVRGLDGGLEGVPAGADLPGGID
nr:hypothetical protein [Streptomyces sp. Ag82_O1-15]